MFRRACSSPTCCPAYRDLGVFLLVGGTARTSPGCVRTCGLSCSFERSGVSPRLVPPMGYLVMAGLLIDHENPPLEIKRALFLTVPSNRGYFECGGASIAHSPGVPLARVELAHPFGHQVLSLACLPFHQRGMRVAGFRFDDGSPTTFVGVPGFEPGSGRF